MTKIRFYQVNLKDGHDSWSEIVPAHSAGNAEAYNNNPHINAMAEFIGFYEVSFYYDDFNVIFEGCGREFNPDSVGYNYLYSHMRASINKMLAKIEDY
ncbi:TPA: hypothetical protein RUX00_004186 [Aeromonas dhakensis]|uniref:hypothetical protein n=1 Tax=Aeromonas veronii TaxID=654 RepID=UPI0028DA95DF|nr:hypothetical protein [Aeromonas dhakensis]